jgi:hypothetical protein
MVASVEHDPGSGVTPYDRLAFGAAEVSRWLARSERADELRLLFGSDAHAELTALAQEAARARPPVSRAPRVWIVPGIMGSQLAARRDHGLPPDLLWLDAIDIVVGRLARLRVGAEPRLRASAVLLPSYLRLGLRLRAAGFAPRWFAYDWRLGVQRSGARFAAALRRDARPACIVAHSLGGLVTREALAHPGLPAISQLVLLGVPAAGSYAAVQALRGTYTVVRKLAQLDRHHDADSLARDVFASFPSLYDLLPRDATARDTDFFDRAQWPAAGLGPEPRLLQAARRRARPATASAIPCASVVGVGTPTVVQARLSADRSQFEYQLSAAGDGTVPADSAGAGGGALHFTRVAHSDLPRDATVTAAVVDLLAEGSSTRLARRAEDCSTASPPQQQVCDAQLRDDPASKVDWHAMSGDARRIYLERLNELP